MKSVSGITAAMALGGGSIIATASAASAADDSSELRIVDRRENDPRMWYYQFATDAIGWQPAVNVLLPDDYQTSGLNHPGFAGDSVSWEGWGHVEAVE